MPLDAVFSRVPRELAAYLVCQDVENGDRLALIAAVSFLTRPQDKVTK